MNPAKREKSVKATPSDKLDPIKNRDKGQSYGVSRAAAKPEIRAVAEVQVTSKIIQQLEKNKNMTVKGRSLVTLVKDKEVPMSLRVKMVPTNR